MKYEVLNHACVRLEGSVVIYADPYGLSRERPDADLIFITHAHHDHFSPEDIRRVAKPDTLIVMPKSMAQPSGTQAVALSPGETAVVTGIEIEAIPAYNIAKKFHPRENGWLGYVITLDGVRCYIAGDTDCTPEAEAVACDVAFLPVGGTYTCTAEEAAALAKAIAPTIEAVPIHYGSVVGSAEDALRFRRLLLD